MTAPMKYAHWQLYRSFLRFLAKKRNVGGGGGEVHPICVLLPKIPNAWEEVWPKDTSHTSTLAAKKCQSLPSLIGQLEQQLEAF